MANKNSSKPKLSKGILEMKFMQRTKEKVNKEIEAAEGREMYSSEITERMKNSKSNFIMEPSFVHCENLIEGRLSFRGMNPEIERLLELEKAEKEATKRHEQSTDVSNEEMVKFYHDTKAAGAGRTMENKFNKYKKVNKRHANNDGHDDDAQTVTMPNERQNHGFAGKKKRGKFMKPNDD
ncbi:M-phase phosphoprotein 6 [Musca vetustissima]|uniref:M-phase phosphoprotein 6 n=1 Tax=Musca vetustissima TaxID=27455 RepID=UPI002AB67521|nr:M-phase phosphoprotein 6 [Musca vetustissima]